jgi:hypothetical protein
VSKDAGNDLLKAIVAAIKADTALASHIGTRVFSSWENQEVAMPLIRLSLPVSRQFEADGAGEGSETDIWVHVFTTESAPIVCRTIAGLVRDVLERASLALDGSDLIALDYRDTLIRRDDQSPLLQTAIVRLMATTSSK